MIHIENGPNYHTYTFNIIREGANENAPLENLVLSPLSDGTYREMLFSYHLTPNEKQILADGGFVNTEGKLSVIELGNNVFNPLASKVQTQNCHLEIDFHYTKCSENVHDHGEQYPDCKATKLSELVYVITEVCTPNPNGSDDPNIPDYPNLPGGGGGDDGGSSPDPCNGNGVLTGPQTPVSGIGYDSDGGCTGIPTQPNIPNPNNNPCEQIKAQRTNTDFTQRITDLQGKTTLKKETGYIQKNGGDYVYMDNATATEDKSSLSLPNPPTNTYIKGYMHTHINDYNYTDANGNITPKIGVKIFSPSDVTYFMDMLRNARNANRPLGNVYAIMVATLNIYQIRFTGNSTQIKQFTPEQEEDLLLDFADFMKNKIKKSKDLELGFLSFLEQEMQITGVNLYRMNSDGTTTEIHLNADKTDTVETNCPI